MENIRKHKTSAMMADESGQNGDQQKLTRLNRWCGFYDISWTHGTHAGFSIAVWVFLMVALFTPSFVVINNHDRSFFNLMCTNDQAKELTATLMDCPTSVTAVKILLPLATMLALFSGLCIWWAHLVDKKAEKGGEALEWGSFTYVPFIFQVFSCLCWIGFFITYMVKIDDMKYWDGAKTASHSLSYSNGYFFWLIIVIWISYFCQGIPQFILYHIRIRIKKSINYGKKIAVDGINMITNGAYDPDRAQGVRHY